MTPGLDSLFGQAFGGYRLTQLIGNDGASPIFLGQRDGDSPVESAPEQARIRVFILPASRYPP